jgi:hypothetical protein
LNAGPPVFSVGRLVSDGERQASGLERRMSSLRWPVIGDEHQAPGDERWELGANWVPGLRRQTSDVRCSGRVGSAVRGRGLASSSANRRPFEFRPAASESVTPWSLALRGIGLAGQESFCSHRMPKLQPRSRRGGAIPGSAQGSAKICRFVAGPRRTKLEIQSGSMDCPTRACPGAARTCGVAPRDCEPRRRPTELGS